MRAPTAPAASCTYDEEMTNFANWYAYYKTRNQMMKTAVGQAFQALNSNYNVGIVSLELAAAAAAPPPRRSMATSSGRANSPAPTAATGTTCCTG
jgi:type IV pilus assembly protein PilY1